MLYRIKLRISIHINLLGRSGISDSFILSCDILHHFYLFNSVVHEGVRFKRAFSFGEYIWPHLSIEAFVGVSPG